MNGEKEQTQLLNLFCFPVKVARIVLHAESSFPQQKYCIVEATVQEAAFS